MVRPAAVPPATALSLGPDGPGSRVEAGRLRPAWAEVDLAAIGANVATLARVVAPASVCAVVKAWGYGHGPVQVARAAIDGGARSLAVALVEEGRQLREGGIDAPVLLLSEPSPAAMAEVVGSHLTPTLYTPAGLAAVTAAARAAGRRVDVHVKVDTGMHRVGATPTDAVALAMAAHATPELNVEGLYTHLAVADEPDDPYTARQLALFQGAVDSLAAAGMRPPVLHAANSAGALWHPAARYDMVRCGIAVYGLSPADGEEHRGAMGALRPVLSLVARVSFVKTLDAGERLSYGLRYRLAERSVIATVPLGYADGVPRSLAAAGGEALVGGRRCRIAGTVTMDQILLDCGPGAEVAPGDEVVLLGRQGDESIDAWEWARRTGTVAYEIVCGVSGRVPRAYRGA